MNFIEKCVFALFISLLVQITLISIILKQITFKKQNATQEFSYYTNFTFYFIVSLFLKNSFHLKLGISSYLIVIIGSIFSFRANYISTIILLMRIAILLSSFVVILFVTPRFLLKYNDIYHKCTYELNGK